MRLIINIFVAVAILMQTVALLMMFLVMRHLLKLLEIHLKLMSKTNEAIEGLQILAEHNKRGLELLVYYYSQSDIIANRRFFKKKTETAAETPKTGIEKGWPIIGFGNDIYPPGSPSGSPKN